MVVVGPQPCHRFSKPAAMDGFVDFGQLPGNNNFALTAEDCTQIGQAFDHAMRRLIEHQHRRLGHKIRQHAAPFGAARGQEPAEQETAVFKTAGR